MELKIRKRARKLTKKERGFIGDYIETGNGAEAARRNYNIGGKGGSLTKIKAELTAGAIATENLKRPIIQKAIAERLPDELLEERHLELLNKREVFKEFNGEGRMIDQPETQAVSRGLDMAYKIKGAYAPEKHLVIATQVPKEVKDRLDLLLKQAN